VRVRGEVGRTTEEARTRRRVLSLARASTWGRPVSSAARSDFRDPPLRGGPMPDQLAVPAPLEGRLDARRPGRLAGTSQSMTGAIEAAMVEVADDRTRAEQVAHGAEPAQRAERQPADSAGPKGIK
jgi:hypothetical protein